MICFKFRCTYAGYAYFDCITPTSNFEIRHGNGVDCGYTKDCPAIEPHWSGVITPEVQAAWVSHCSNEQAEYERWRERHAYLFATQPAAQPATATEGSV